MMARSNRTKVWHKYTHTRTSLTVFEHIWLSRRLPSTFFFVTNPTRLGLLNPTHFQRNGPLFFPPLFGEMEKSHSRAYYYHSVEHTTVGIYACGLPGGRNKSPGLLNNCYPPPCSYGNGTKNPIWLGSDV